MDRFRATWPCIFGDPVAPECGIYIDWRYFYALGEGRAACGRVGAEFLRLVGTPKDFLEPQSLDNLKMAGKNPSMLGFFVEQVTLSWISISGCPLLGQRFGTRPATTLFRSTSGMPVHLSVAKLNLYIPTTHTIPATDAFPVSSDE